MVKIVCALVKNPELAIEYIDDSFVKTHEHSTDAASPDNEAIGRRKGRNNTKIHMAADSKGRSIGFELSAGNINDSTVAPELIRQLEATEFFADKGYDSESIRTLVLKNGAMPIIPRKNNSTV